MNQLQHNRLVSFIWGIADDVLRDVYVRGKYRDVILPMTVIRRLDALLDPTKDAVLKMHAQLNKAKVANQEKALCKASGQEFYNISGFTLRRLMDNPKQLRANFLNYLDGFSPNVAEIISKFAFRNQVDKLHEADVLGHLIEKFLSPDINLSPKPVLNGDGSEKHPALTNLGMGYVFEELIRKFNEENNEEAGEHFTPREIVHLMAALLVEPVNGQIKSGTYTIYDCAAGTGGMLTESEAELKKLAAKHNKEVSVHFYGQEVNAETFAICKADLLIKGEDESNITFGSTLSNDQFSRQQFDFMIANPPYGKSWKTDLDKLCGGNKGEMRDPRFIVNHDGNPEFSLVTRSSDGQLMFLANLLSKMKDDPKSLGSRIAIVHNGSVLFTGDAGQGESNIRQWILEKDWLEAIIGLPENMFYNTGIATYIWVLTNRKPKTRRGKVQLIDATQWFTKLRKNLGNKNCEFSPEQIEQIFRLFMDFKETEQSKIFENEDFGYQQITVERPLRLRTDFSLENLKQLKDTCVETNDEAFVEFIEVVAGKVGKSAHLDFNKIWAAIEASAAEHDLKLTGKREKIFREILCQRDETAEPVILKRHKGGKVEYEADPELRDHENVPLKESIEKYFDREVLPYIPDAWIDTDKTIKGYEIPFTKHFYKFEPLRDLDLIADELQTLEQETDGLLRGIVEVANNQPQ